MFAPFGVALRARRAGCEAIDTERAWRSNAFMTEAAAAAPETQGGTMRFPASKALRLDSGARLGPLEIAYNTYGRLNADRSNAVLVCHALTGDQHVASVHPTTGKPGWWSRMIGPGKPLDPDRHFIICSNVIGGRMGSAGP